MSGNDKQQIDPARRSALVGSALAAVAAAVPFAAAGNASAATPAGKVTKTASIITTRDDVQIYYKDWGPRNGQPVVLSTAGRCPATAGNRPPSTWPPTDPAWWCTTAAAMAVPASRAKATT